MLCFGELVHAIYVLYVTIISLNKAFLIVHDVFIWWLFEAINLYWTKMSILYCLHVLKLIEVLLHFCILRLDCGRNSVTHLLVWLYIKIESIDYMRLLFGKSSLQFFVWGWFIIEFLFQFIGVNSHFNLFNLMNFN